MFYTTSAAVPMQPQPQFTTTSMPGQIPVPGAPGTNGQTQMVMTGPMVTQQMQASAGPVAAGQPQTMTMTMTQTVSMNPSGGQQLLVAPPVGGGQQQHIQFSNALPQQQQQQYCSPLAQMINQV